MWVSDANGQLVNTSFLLTIKLEEDAQSPPMANESGAQPPMFYLIGETPPTQEGKTERFCFGMSPNKHHLMASRDQLQRHLNYVTVTQTGEATVH